MTVTTYEPVIKVEKLTKRFGSKTTVDNINFTLQKGAILGLLGPNGAGKTTTLRMITGLCPSTDGTVEIGGVDVKKDPGKALSRLGAALDTPNFYGDMSGWKNLKYSADLYGNIPTERIETLLELVSLSNAGQQKVSRYSLGMRQRLSLARTLLADPELVILDELANGLDPAGMIELYQIIRTLAHEKGVAFILSSHLLHDVETLSSDVLILNKGVCIAYGATNTLLSGGNRIVEIVTPKPAQIQSAFHGLTGVELIRQEHIKVIYRLDECPMDVIVNRLADCGAPVQDLHTRHKTLEDIFLELTGGLVR